MFCQHFTYAIAGFSALQTTVAMNVFYNFTFMIRKCSNYLTTSEAARTAKHSQQTTRVRDKQDYSKEYNAQSSESAR